MLPAQTKDLFKNGQLQTGSAAAARLRRGKHQEEAGQGEGPYIYASKMNMMQFVYGQDEAPVPEGTLFAFNIMTAQTGYSYWFKKKVTIKATSIWDENPIDLDDLPDPQEYGQEEIAKMGKNFYGQPEWAPYYRWDLQAVHGPNLDIKGVYHGAQLYLRRLSEKLIDEAAARIEDDERIIPVCRLYNEPYDHPAGHGMTSSHKVDILGWAAVDGTEIDWIGDPPMLEGPKPKKQTRRSRRAA